MRAIGQVESYDGDSIRVSPNTSGFSVGQNLVAAADPERKHFTRDGVVFVRSVDREARTLRVYGTIPTMATWDYLFDADAN